MFEQTFELRDVAIIGLLVILEGILSIDNALVLALLAKPLSPVLRKKALTYGLIGAFVFRLLAIAVAASLLKWPLVKLLGGGYLVYVAVKHFISAHSHSRRPPGEIVVPKVAKFWPTVFVIEMTDIAFAVDSIVAAIGVVGPPPEGATRHPKLWVVLAGGFMGVILMRFAAVIFLRLLERFPRFETSAYLLVLIIGGKLMADWKWEIDFHHGVPAYTFWGLMLLCFGFGFIRPKNRTAPVPPPIELP